MIIKLSEQFGTIKIAGNDARAFLQNQLSNDIDLVNANNSQISSYNSPKGRVYAIFRIIQAGQDYLLITTRSQIDFLVKRLSMFVLRSDVTISDQSEQYKLYGLQQHDTDKPDIPYPVSNNRVCEFNNAYIACVSNAADRYIILTTDLPSTFADLDHAPIEDWLFADIQAGIAHIFSGAKEQFVAQMLNLDLIDGINFQKGCYPGQEIIARTKYRGTVKKRLFHISWPGDSDIPNGQSIYRADDQKHIGQLVYSCKLADGYQALAVINIDTNTDTVLTMEVNDTPISASIINAFLEPI